MPNELLSRSRQGQRSDETAELRMFPATADGKRGGCRLKRLVHPFCV